MVSRYIWDVEAVCSTHTTETRKDYVMIKAITECTKDELQNLVSNSYSYSEVLRKLGYKNTGHNQTLKAYIKLYDIDINHFYQKIGGKDFKLKYTNEDIFIKGCKCNLSTSNIKNRLLRCNLLEYRCALCGNEGYWNNKPLVLQLDHIDGDRTNNLLTNLRFLCPNCHTQTKTYSNKKLKERRNCNLCLEN